MEMLLKLIIDLERVDSKIESYPLEAKQNIRLIIEELERLSK